MLVGLAACEDFEGLDFLNGAGADEEVSAVTPVAGDVTERDVEAPEIFSANEPGLWDGRPSLGGVWVAYPGIKDPERVIIRNTENGQFVIGALFRRERENPGPKLQMSSDAAQALGMLAGQPAEISVVALRKEEVAPVLNTDTEALDAAAEEGLDADAVLAGVPAAETIDATPLGTVEAATPPPQSPRPPPPDQWPRHLRQALARLRKPSSRSAFSRSKATQTTRPPACAALACCPSSKSKRTRASRSTGCSSAPRPTKANAPHC